MFYTYISYTLYRGKIIFKLNDSDCNLSFPTRESIICHLGDMIPKSDKELFIVLTAFVVLYFTNFFALKIKFLKGGKSEILNYNEIHNFKYLQQYGKMCRYLAFIDPL